MTLICNVCAVFLFIMATGASVMGAPASLADFILQRGGTEADMQALGQPPPASICFSTPTQAICVDKEKYAGLEKNAQARAAVLRGIQLKARQSLYARLLETADRSKFRNRQAASETYLSGINSGEKKYLLKNVEFFSLFEEGICYGVAAASIKNAMPELEENIRKPFFSDEYCGHLYPKARALMAQKRYDEALVILKELHDLKFANIPAYLLAAHAFLKTGQTDDANKLAIELWNDFSLKMNAEQSEDLGDIFMELKDAGMAEKAYQLAQTELEKRNNFTP